MEIDSQNATSNLSSVLQKKTETFDETLKYQTKLKFLFDFIMEEPNQRICTERHYKEAIDILLDTLIRGVSIQNDVVSARKIYNRFANLTYETPGYGTPNHRTPRADYFPKTAGPDKRYDYLIHIMLTTSAEYGSFEVFQYAYSLIRCEDDMKDTLRYVFTISHERSHEKIIEFMNKTNKNYKNNKRDRGTND